MARARKSQNGKAAEFVCPECGRSFTRAAALGAHRRQAHGVVGVSRQARSAKSGASTSATRTAQRTNPDEDARPGRAERQWLAQAARGARALLQTAASTGTRCSKRSSPPAFRPRKASSAR